MSGSWVSSDGIGGSVTRTSDFAEGATDVLTESREHLCQVRVQPEIVGGVAVSLRPSCVLVGVEQLEGGGLVDLPHQAPVTRGTPIEEGERLRRLLPRVDKGGAGEENHSLPRPGGDVRRCRCEPEGELDRRRKGRPDLRRPARDILGILEPVDVGA